MTAALAAHDAVPAPRLDYALPGWAVDVIREGVPGTDARRAWAAALSVAMSAHARQWTEAQYVNAVADTHSRLWAQLMVKRDGRRGSLPAAMKSLRKAWSTAGANIANTGVRDREDIAAEAVELAYYWADRLDARTDGLSATESAVMGYVVRHTETRGMLRVTCPRRGVAEECGIGEEAAKRALVRLTDRGLLVRHSKGRPHTKGSAGQPAGGGRAAIYGLAVDVGGVPVVPGSEDPIDTGSLPMGCEGAEEVAVVPPLPYGVSEVDPPATVTATPPATHDAQSWVIAAADALTARGIDAAELPDAAWDALRRAYVDGEDPEEAAARLAPENADTEGTAS